MTGYRYDRLRILIVDDSAHMRKLVSTILHAFGIVHVAEADNAKSAWTLLREVHSDVVLLDWMMEGMSGVEFTKMVRTHPSSPNPFVPIIMLSGHTSLERIQEARDSGVSEFLAKPVSVNGIMTRLISVIENPRPFVRTKAYYGPCRRRRSGDEYRGPERRENPDGLPEAQETNGAALAAAAR